MFIKEKIYKRTQIHEAYGGQRQGGISTPTSVSVIFLFTGDQGERYGYADSWTDDGLFRLTGEGQRGDMEFVRGNRAIRDHANDGKDLHLFQYVKPAYVRYLGQVICTGMPEIQTHDLNGQQRKAIVFELTPIEKFSETRDVTEADIEDQLWAESLETLRQKALNSGAETKTPKQRQVEVKYRSAAVKVFALKRAKGTCEACKQPAPFQTSKNQPYLEVHHIRRLSDGGPDHPDYVIALCPNCHRRAHHSDDKNSFNDRLLKRLSHIG